MVNPMHVFVIDDDASARTGLTCLLRAANYDVQSFALADDFLDALTGINDCPSELHGCVVVDAGMPGLLGEDLTSELKKSGYRLPIIVVTGDDDVVTRQRALTMEAVGFFRKPIDGTALLDAVGWALQSSQAERIRVDRKPE